MKLKLINHGVAYYCEEGSDRWVEINRALLDDPLFNEVLHHEIDHSEATNIWQQLYIDVKDALNFKKQIRLAMWQMNHLESFTNILPVHIGKRTSVNWFMSIFWVFFFGVMFIVLVYLFRTYG